MCREKILIIENNPLTIQFERQILEKNGQYEIICIDKDFHNITEDFLENHNISLILLDIQLGSKRNHISGIDIAKTIRNSKNEKIKQTPIFVISLMKNEMEKIIKETKCNMFFNKPCNKDILAFHVKKVLKN